MSIEGYKTILYRQEDGSWVAEIPAIPGCYALMPGRGEALAELSCVFEIISEEYREKCIPPLAIPPRAQRLSCASNLDANCIGGFSQAAIQGGQG
jgi:predicted RNase H-like HicB family nuclease